MVDYKTFFVCALTWLLCGLGFVDTAKALNMEVYSILPGGRMVNLPDGALLYSDQKIQLSVKADTTGQLAVRYFEDGTPVKEISLTIKDPLKPYYFPSRSLNWRLTGDPGTRRFEVVLQSKNVTIERAQWSGQYVDPAQVKLGTKTTSTKLTTLKMPEALENALAVLRKLPIERPSSVITRGGSEGSRVYKKTADSIVKVFVGKSVMGSGVVISEDGLIVTNYHVIQNHKIGNVLLRADGIKLKPCLLFEVVGTFPLQDLAFIKVRFDKMASAPAIKLGNLQDVDEGDPVYAVGHPKNHGWTISPGILTGKRPNFVFGKHKGYLQRADLLQTNASISTGNSGGALLDRQGALIGINTFAEAEAQNLNFAISVDEVIQAKEDLERLAPPEPREKRPSLHPDEGRIISKLDRNKNGFSEIVYYDAFGENGIVDWVVIDKDEDKISDIALIDSNENGKIDQYMKIVRIGSRWNIVHGFDHYENKTKVTECVDIGADGSWDRCFPVK